MSEVYIVVLNPRLLVREDENSRGNPVSLLGDAVQDLEDRSKAGAVLASHQHQAAAHWVSEGDEGSGEIQCFNIILLCPPYMSAPTVGPSSPSFLVSCIFGVYLY